MKLTKYEHACMVITTGKDSIVIDPGSYTMPLSDLDGVVAIVITHEHQDHWTPEQLDRILDRNPDAKIIGPAGVAAAAAGYTIDVVTGGDERTVEPFDLKFFGEKHEPNHKTIPVVDNVGVLVNDQFYYGGDSYTLPGVEVDTLAVPVGAPWLRIGDVIDYVTEIKPRKTFPAHEVTLSVIGKNMANTRVESATTAGGGEFFPLDAGESLEL